VIGGVLSYNVDSHPWKALVAQDVVTIEDFLALDEEAIKKLSYVLDNETDFVLSVGHQMKLVNLRRWAQSKGEEGINEEIWMSLTRQDFAKFTLGASPASTAASPSTQVITSVAPSSSAATSAVESFQKGICRDPKDYNVFDDQGKFLMWRRHVMTTARSHGVYNVLDEKYTPPTGEDETLLNLQGQFMYKVFESTVKLSQGRLIIRQHEEKADGRAVWVALNKTYAGGVAAELLCSKLETELVTLRLTSSWNKTMQAFLTMWENKVQDLVMVRAQAPKDIDRYTWLKSSLSTHPGMQAVISMFESNRGMYSLMKSMRSSDDTSPMDVPFDHFFAFLMDEATKLDKASADSKKGTRQAKKINQRGKKGDERNQPKHDKWWIDSDKWSKMTPAERTEHLKKKRESQKRTGKDDTKTKSNITDVNNIPGYQVKAAATAPPTETKAPSAPDDFVKNLLSSQQGEAVKSTAEGTYIVQKGKVYRIAASKLQYHVANIRASPSEASLVDGGANGGMAGDDVLLLGLSTESVDVSTADSNNTMTNLPLGQFAGMTETLHGETVIVLLGQYAHNAGAPSTIHSANQLRFGGHLVDDVPKHYGGKQCITTSCGHILPLVITNGLAHLALRKPTLEDVSQFPNVILTPEAGWDPTEFDDGEQPAEDFEDAPMDLADVAVDIFHDLEQATDDRVDQYGNYRHRDDYDVDCCIFHAKGACTFETAPKVIIAAKHAIKPKEPNYEHLKPYLGWVNVNRIKETLRNTTQWFRADSRRPLRRHFKTRFPAANVPRLNETVCTDTFFSDTPAAHDGITGHGGATMLQLYVGRESNFTKGYPMTSESQVPGTFEDFIRDVGAPQKLVSDNAKSETGKRMTDLLRLYCVKDGQSEPHQQNQNYAEQKIGQVKRMVNGIMDRTGTPAVYWLLCTLFSICLLNHLALDSLNWKTPMEVAFNQQPDISPFLQYHWWQKVYYAVDNTFPSQSPEKSGRWVGVAEKQGDILTYLILTDDTKQVLARSAVRPALPHELNLRTPDFAPTLPPNADVLPDLLAGEEAEMPLNDNPKIYVKDIIDLLREQGVDAKKVTLPTFSPDELVGRTFLRDLPDGQRVRAEVVKKVLDRDAENHEQIKMLLKLGGEDDALEEVITYGELSDLIQRQDQEELNDPDREWIFKEVKAHEGPLKPTDPKYMGSTYNVLVLWEDNSETWQPLQLMIKSDPVTCAKYAKEHSLLELPGWKTLKRYAKNEKKLKRLINQVRMDSMRNAPTFKFGVQVPRSKTEAYALDKKNGNSKWVEAMQTELSQLLEYKTFEDKGHIKDVGKPQGYTFIRCHFVYDVKHDLRRKARLVAGGNMTAPPRDSVYSGVVSLRSIRLALLAAELNGLSIMAGDVGNAYLEAETKEKIYTIAGPEFGELEGHILIIRRALYGLRTSGARWHERFAETLRAEGFKPCKADPDLWIRDAGDKYEYICVYVDDLLCMMKDPQAFMDRLKCVHGYKLKGVGPPSYHLGANYFRDPDGTLAMGAMDYVNKILANYERLFGEKPRMVVQPVETNDHPEIDASELLSKEGINHYQSLIGELQWAVSLGRFDIHQAVMSMSRFRAAPREGHLRRLKRVFGYLRKYPEAAIRFRTEIPQHQEPEHKFFDWAHSVYGDEPEEVPTDLPEPKGKSVRTTSCVDANLYHCLVTGRACTGILHFVNQTPIEWFSKRQGSVETATYGSEFVAARQATEQIMDLRYTLRAMGMPVDGPSWMFGDNQSVITSSTIPHSLLSKRHNALSYHRVREAIARKIFYFCKIEGNQNPADCLTKPAGHQVFWPIVRLMLFWRGDTKKGGNGEATDVVAQHALRGVANPHRDT
jgi:hypothetical protein